MRGPPATCRGELEGLSKRSLSQDVLSVTLVVCPGSELRMQKSAALDGFAVNTFCANGLSLLSRFNAVSQTSITAKEPAASCGGVNSPVSPNRHIARLP